MIINGQNLNGDSASKHMFLISMHDSSLFREVFLYFSIHQEANELAGEHRSSERPFRGTYQIGAFFEISLLLFLGFHQGTQWIRD